MSWEEFSAALHLLAEEQYGAPRRLENAREEAQARQTVKAIRDVEGRR